MAAANAIARCVAVFADGSSIVYRDWDESHIRKQRFAEIMAKRPASFAAVTTDGGIFAVDLVDGSLLADGERYETFTQPTPLRLIYYKHMTFALGKDALPQCEYFVVGWQTTTEQGRNLKVGLKVYPAERRWEITEAI